MTSLASVVWQCLPFSQLMPNQLYDIMQLRQEVFAVEQQCVYLDADGKDQSAWHLCGYTKEALEAYCRILAPGIQYKEPSIGRVVTSQRARGQGIGKELMRVAMQQVEEKYPGRGVRISAQLYLKAFYQSFGFIAVTEPYQEDGIPHVEMLATNQ